MEKSELLNRLSTARPSILLGIDGMIDEVWELLDTRSGPDSYVKMTNMLQFGAAITERKCGGLAKERLLKRRTSGGFVCNTGRAALSLGADTTLLGMFGREHIATIFEEFRDSAVLVSVGDPLTILVLEFPDGKIMLPSLEDLINLKWEDVVARVGEARLRDLCRVDIMGVGYWSNLYDFENIMTNLVTDYLQNGTTKRCFHDFANLNKRSPEALRHALEVLGKLNRRLPQTLSLNEHEGGILARELGIAYPQDVNRPECEGEVLSAAAEIRQQIGLDEVLIHTLYFAVGATAQEGSASVSQDYCHNAIKTTGAGDTFNGGYMVASMADLDLQARLLTANATTRYYVEHAFPPTMEQLMKQIERSGI